MKKNERGITLIALVITIIVMLILVGVTISAIVGEDGITNRAQNAKEQTVIADEKESVLMAKNVAIMEGEVNKENLDLELDKRPGVGKYISEEVYDAEGNDAVAVTFTDTNRTYFVTHNGTIVDELEHTKITNRNFFEIDSTTGTVTMKWDKSQNHDGIGFYYNDANEKILPEENIVIPAKINGTEVKKIRGFYWSEDSGAFYNASNLKSIVIPNTVEVIEESAFYNCKELEKVTLSNTLKTIENSAFMYCESLKEIFIPKSVTTIESNAFYRCNNLTKITIEEGSNLELPTESWNINWGATNAEVIFK